MSGLSERLWTRFGPRRLLVFGIAGVVCLAGLQWGAGWLLMKGDTGGARWIWAAGSAPGEECDVFFAVRDFEVAAVPGGARLRALADEEMVVLLNGTPVGSRRYFDGAPLAVWEVADLLRKGSNRLAVELRSGRGVGGFILSLVGGEELRLGTDSSWRVYRRFERALLRPGTELAEGEVPAVWSTAPTGRWGAPREGPLLPVLADLTNGGEGTFAVRARPLQQPEWVSAGEVDWRSTPLGTRVIFDWGREVFGYPNVIFGDTEGGMALVWAGIGPPPTDGPVSAYLVNLPGRRSWTEAEPRRFRYLTVMATREITGARVYSVDAEAAERAGMPPPLGKGVFGVEPLALVAPVEHEIRRAL